MTLYLPLLQDNTVSNTVYQVTHFKTGLFGLFLTLSDFRIETTWLGLGA